MSAPWPWQVAAGLVAGAALAWVFLRALRASIERLPARAHPGRWILGGFMLRAVLVVAGFAVIARVVQAPGLAAALAGFLIARTWALRKVRRTLAAQRPVETAR